MKLIATFVFVVLALTALVCGISTPVAKTSGKGFNQMAQTSMPYPKPTRPGRS